MPFENLDIWLQRPIELDPEALYAKVVSRGRGGFCYELNGLFAQLLRAIGFHVELLAASVARAGGGFGPPFDHLALRVELDQAWLVDVGFGDGAEEPLALTPRVVQLDPAGRFRLDREGERLLVMRERDAGFTPAYLLDLRARSLHEFAATCRDHQRLPDSPFTGRRICTRRTGSGRVTLTDDRLIETGRVRRELPIDGEAAWHSALACEFGIVVE